MCVLFLPPFPRSLYGILIFELSFSSLLLSYMFRDAIAIDIIEFPFSFFSLRCEQ